MAINSYHPNGDRVHAAAVEEPRLQSGVRTGKEMTCFEEEIKGIFSVQLYDAVACDAIVRSAERAGKWSAASVGEEHSGTYDAAVRPEYRWAETFSPTARSKVTRDFDAKLDGVIKPFIRDAWRVELREHSGTHIVRYSPGGFYVTHADAGLDLNDRYFTVLCYLNDDFEGGHTSFPLLDWSITPKKGTAVVFPATYLHRGEPVLKGQKYILVTWLTGEVPVEFV